MKKDNTVIYHSSLYNIRMILSPILLKNFYQSYIDYLEYAFTFIPDKSIANYYLKSNFNPGKLSGYLIFNILYSMLKTNSIVKKDVESYYNKQMINYYEYHNLAKDLKLKTLALKWIQINKIINYIFENIDYYDMFETLYRVNWSDGINNFYEEIPLIGFKENKLDVFFIIQKDLDKYPINGTINDLITIPSITRCLSKFIRPEFKLNKVKIIYLDNTDINKNITIVEYPSHLFNKDFKTYLQIHGDNNNYKNPLLTYTNISNYYTNNIFTTKDYLTSVNHNNLRNNAHLIYSTSEISKV